MKKLQMRGRIVVLMAVLILLACLLAGGGVLTTYANELPAETEQGEQTEGDADDALVEGFLNELKEKYGADYEKYYNAILEKWGSIEAYLLSAIDDADVPDVVADGWRAALNWLGEYSPIWATVLAVLAILFIILFGKKALKKVGTWLHGANDSMQTVFGAINKIYTAHVAEANALMKLLGDNERFSAEREALRSATEEIRHEDV